MSFRARMTWLIVLVIAIVVALYGFTVLAQLDRVFHNELDDHLHRDFEQATQSLAYENGQWSWKEAQHYHDEQETVAQRIEIWSLKGDRRYVRHVTDELDTFELAPPVVWDADYRSVPFAGGNARVLTGKYTAVSNSSPSLWYLRVIRTDTPVQAKLRTMLTELLSMYPVALLLAAAGGWWLSGQLLQPIAKLGEAARAIHAGALDQRLPVARDDEIGRLAAIFNTAFCRLEKAFEQLSRFSSDVAHELRTPLTALRNQGELALRNPAAAMDDDTRKLLIAMLDESSRLGRMIDRLLLIARADQGRMAAELTVHRLAPIAEDAINLMQVLAEERGITLSLRENATVCAMVDADFLQQVLIDLLDNALRHAATAVTVHIACEASCARIDIDDDGRGIAEKDRECMLQRFVRGDEARTRTGSNPDGFGLGLAIAASLTALQEGTLELEQAPGDGTGKPGGLSVRLRFALANHDGEEAHPQSKLAII